MLNFVFQDGFEIPAEAEEGVADELETF